MYVPVMGIRIMQTCAKMLLLLMVLVSCAASADDLSDPRLSEKVTIDCVNGRLYNALDRISAETGVTLHAGRTTHDWQVRDYPVVVCARDLPLGVLLRSIADATHLLLSKTGPEEEVAYRIWRDARRRSELDAFEKKRASALRAAIAWDWDTIVAGGKRLVEGDRRLPGTWVPSHKGVSEALSYLGEGVRDRVIDGENIVFVVANAPPAVQTLFREWLKDVDYYDYTLEEKLNTCCVDIRTRQRGAYDGELHVEAWIIRGRAEFDTSDYPPWLTGLDAHWPDRPVVPSAVLEADRLPSRYVRFDPLKDGGPAFLDTKLSIPAPEGKKSPTYSDLLPDISDAIGYSIVAEGCAARYCPPVDSFIYRFPGMFDREITVREALSWASRNARQQWYLDEENKLILGRDPEWNERVKGLVPEKLLVDLAAKLKGSGLDLEDLEPVVNLTEEQCRQWIGYCPEFPDVEAIPERIVQGGTFIRLYLALSASDRALAKAGTPVSLDGCDPGLVAEVLRRFASWYAKHLCLGGHTDQLTAPMLKAESLLDPGYFRHATIHLEKHYGTTDPKVYTYLIHVTADIGGKAETVTHGIPAAIPIRARAEQTESASGER